MARSPHWTLAAASPDAMPDTVDCLQLALARTDATAFNPFPVTFKIVNNQIVVDQPYKNPASAYDGIYGDEAFWAYRIWV